MPAGDCCKEIQTQGLLLEFLHSITLLFSSESSTKKKFDIYTNIEFHLNCADKTNEVQQPFVQNTAIIHNQKMLFRPEMHDYFFFFLPVYILQGWPDS